MPESVSPAASRGTRSCHKGTLDTVDFATVTDAEPTRRVREKPYNQDSEATCPASPGAKASDSPLWGPP